MSQRGSGVQHHRYPGARSFEDRPEDRELFFGRERESIHLAHQIQAKRLVVLYGKSGLGKTSLLQASVFEQLRQADFLPLRARVNELDGDPIELILGGIAEAATHTPAVDFIAGDTDGLWRFFKTAEFWRGDTLLTPVLVLDQFEEIFTLQTAGNRRRIAQELGDLVRGGLPASVRAQLTSGEQLPYDETPPEVKLVLSLREEYVGTLQDLFAEVPAILNERFRLAALTREQAEEAIVEPARKPRDSEFTTEAFEFEPKTLNRLLDYLARGGAIEPFQLQVLCAHAERQIEKRQRKSTAAVAVDDEILGDDAQLDAILKGFYDNAINTLPSRRKRRAARRLCEEGLLSPEGHREILHENRIAREYGLGSTELEQLVESRVLRRDTRPGGYAYELIHDSLARPVASARRFRMPRRFWYGAAVVAIALLALALWQSWQANQALNAERQALIASQDQLRRFIDKAGTAVLEPDMQPIEAGCFNMSLGETSREICVEGFLISKHETTFEDYDAFALATKRKPPDDEGWGRGDRPVINVSWNDARDYAQWLVELTGKRYRLPTEAEWEYAARSRGENDIWSGTSDESELSEYAWYRANSGGSTQQVGTKKANDIGLHDMSGNVWEWTCSEYGGYDGTREKTCTEAGGGQRVIRGGSWSKLPQSLRSAYRNRYNLDGRGLTLGFRLAQDME